MADYKHLCVDGKNAIYRAVFAGYYDPSFKKTGYDYFVILLRFISNYISLLKPEAVHIFWDTPRNKTWRRQVLQEYKEHRTEKYKELTIDIHKELARQTKLAISIFKLLNCRQYYADAMEADDLIYSFCAINDDKTVIVSSDQDFQQITYKMDHVFLYNPLAKTQQIEQRPTHNIVIAKALMGDKSDNINGYYNIGPKRSEALSRCAKTRSDFFKSDKAVIMEDGQLKWVGNSVYKRNRRIIDLSWCPHLPSNCEYIEDKQLLPPVFNTNKIEDIARKFKVRGVLTEISRHSKIFEPIV